MVYKSVIINKYEALPPPHNQMQVEFSISMFRLFIHNQYIRATIIITMAYYNQFNNTMRAYKLTNSNIRLKLLSLQQLPQFNQ